MTPPLRRARGVTPLAVLVAVLSLLLTLGHYGAAQQISYTVQVVALSDLDSATDVQTDLLRQGFPAYVVRSTSSQGDVFRVRVGAFANRQAALLYAEAMPMVAGGQPVPALAEGIPAGITPVTPRLVLSQDVTGLDTRLLRVGGNIALRTQQRTPLLPAEYAILSGGTVERVRAWNLSVDENGARVIVRDMTLWPDTWQEESGEVLDGYQSTLVNLVAERLGLDPATVRAARYGTTAGAPRLIVVERVVPGSAEGPELIGLGLPVSGMTPAGPLQYLGVQPTDLPALPDGVRVDLVSGTVVGELAVAPADGTESETEPETEPDTDTESDTEPEPEPEPEPQSEPGAGGEDASGESATAPQTAVPPAAPPPPVASGAVQGEGWVAEPDGPFVRLTVSSPVAGAGAITWRAALGTPLWSGEGYLLAHVGKSVLIYDFLPRD
ncbi:MAG: SPOR domain-containing protein [Trueperaceae bacterium]